MSHTVTTTGVGSHSFSGPPLWGNGFINPTPFPSWAPSSPVVNPPPAITTPTWKPNDWSPFIVDTKEVQVPKLRLGVMKASEYFSTDTSLPQYPTASGFL